VDTWRISRWLTDGRVAGWTKASKTNPSLPPARNLQEDALLPDPAAGGQEPAPRREPTWEGCRRAGGVAGSEAVGSGEEPGLPRDQRPGRCAGKSRVRDRPTPLSSNPPMDLTLPPGITAPRVSPRLAQLAPEVRKHKNASSLVPFVGSLGSLLLSLCPPLVEKHPPVFFLPFQFC
jgi:hypothetical protein